MIADYKPRSSTNRTVLKDVIPLNTPFVVGVFVGDLCNFKCKYCIQSSDKTNPVRKYLHEEFLNLTSFTLIAKGLSQFPKKLKTLMFSSMGEPTLNPQLPDMVSLANKLDLSETYEVVTNGSTLTSEYVTHLIDAGINRICISLQGITEQKYLDVCDYNLDLDEFISNIRFLYEYSRGKCQIHIKTLAECLDEKEEAIFFNLFGDLCDTIHIDQVIKMNNGVDYSGFADEKRHLFGFDVGEIQICSPIYYTIHILTNGDVVPCCNPPYPVVFGNAMQTSVPEIWTSKKRKQFLISHLKKKKNVCKICSQCENIGIQAFREDILDGYEDDLIQRIELDRLTY